MNTTVIAIVAVLLLVILLVIAYRLERALQRFKIRKSYTAAVEAPSVSVCIPARNEAHAMTQCLERVMASDYRKMEVIVFDDASQDNTSFLIKSFAHAGVRFVPGAEVPDNWLGKNRALEILAREASGTYIIFLDVDTHIKPTTISQIVGYGMTEKLDMVSVLPERVDTWRPAVLFGHLRYFWQLVLSREQAPATASSLWMINRQTLLGTLGGFADHKAEVEPESHIAAELGTASYHCLVSNPGLGVSYEKRWQSQNETSRRLLYPMVGGTWLGGLIGLVVFGLLNLPTMVVVIGIFTGWSLLGAIALVFLLAFGIVYSRYTYALWRRYWWIGVVVWPVVILQEMMLFVASLVGYSRHTITWKGRSVSSPRTI